MNERLTAVLTGSSGGLGREIAELYAQRGWDLVLVNRDPETGQHQAQTLRDRFDGIEVRTLAADLMEPSQIEGVVEEIREAYGSLQRLYNIAGLLTDVRRSNSLGHEAHFAVNTLAPYMLTQGLRSPLSAGSSSSRKSAVVNFSSGVVGRVERLEVGQLSNPPAIGGLMGAYAQTKLALDGVTAGLKDELFAEGILIASVDPGATRTSMTRGNKAMPWLLRLIQPLMFKSARTQAKKLVDGVERAVAEGESGVYISEGRRRPMPPLAEDAAVQSQLRRLLDAAGRPDPG